MSLPPTSTDTSTSAAEAKAAGGASGAVRPAGRSVWLIIGFLLLTTLLLGSDLVSKQAVFHHLLNDPELLRQVEEKRLIYGDQFTVHHALLLFRKPVFPGVQFSLSTNEGVAFGVPMYRGLVAAATVATILMVMYFFLTSPAKGWGVHLALAMILGGAMGNLYDRLLGSVPVPGYEPIRYQVRDFIDCSGLHYPWVFNVADAWLVLGVAILLLAWWRMGRTAGHSPSGAAKN